MFIREDTVCQECRDGLLQEVGDAGPGKRQYRCSGCGAEVEGDEPEPPAIRPPTASPLFSGAL